MPGTIALVFPTTFIVLFLPLYNFSHLTLFPRDSLEAANFLKVVTTPTLTRYSSNEDL